MPQSPCIRFKQSITYIWSNGDLCPSCGQLNPTCMRRNFLWSKANIYHTSRITGEIAMHWRQAHSAIYGPVIDPRPLELQPSRNPKAPAFWVALSLPLSYRAGHALLRVKQLN